MYLLFSEQNIIVSTSNAFPIKSTENETHFCNMNEPKYLSYVQMHAFIRLIIIAQCVLSMLVFVAY